MTYVEFVKHLETKYPEMYSNVYCGIAIEPGWYNIVELASHAIYANAKWKIEQRERLLKDNPHNRDIPDEIDFPSVAQIKEKFGTLRFYVDGGDEFTNGVATMAELMSGRVCETCGDIGSRRSGGWIRTLCDKHEEEYQRMKNESRN